MFICLPPLIIFSGLTKIEQLIETRLNKLAFETTQKDQSVLLSRIEVAKLLKITLPTLHDWTKLGWLQSYKIGNRVLYKSEEVAKALHKVSTNKHKKFTL